MKKQTLLVMLVSWVLACCLVAGCGKKRIERKPVAFVGNDTLTVEDLKRLSADTVKSAVELRRLALQTSLAKRTALPRDTAAHRQRVDEIAQQLSLRSDREWTSAQASALLAAARAVWAEIDTTADPAAVVKHIDSVLASIRLVSDTGGTPKAVALSGSAVSAGDTSAAGKRAALSAALAHSLGLTPELAEIVADFAEEDAGRRADSVSVKDIVKGLVYDPSKEAFRQAARPEVEHVVHDNSALALRYRTRNSIVDSISKHMPYLEALYKKQLKIHQTMAGKVVVSFRVGASGAVMSVRIVRSDIRERDFLKPFAAYVETIRFRPIPAKVGPMTFEFPFEFKAEG